MTSTPDKGANLAAAAGLLAEAAHQGAELVVLPELFNLLGGRDEEIAGAESLDGPTQQWASAQALEHGIWLVAGSIAERRQSGRLANTSCLHSPQGALVATYRKIHLFDNDVPGAAFRESDTFVAGDRLVVSDAPPAAVGMATCFDLRFPEQFRGLALAGARIVVLPAAFTATTGPPHWEVLVRARAIEDQVFMIAADQVGHSTPKLAWHGHSMIVDPWGAVLAEATAPVPGVIVADLDLDAQQAMRAQLPSLASRRPEAYGPA